MTIGDKILEIRERQNISRKELATILNVSLATITRYEKGDRQPNIETLIKIANALNVPIQELIFVSSGEAIEADSFNLLDIYEKNTITKQNLDLLEKSSDNNLYEFQEIVGILIQDTLSTYNKYNSENNVAMAEMLKQLSDIIGTLSVYISHFNPNEINSSLKEIYNFIKFKFQTALNSDEEGE